MKYIGNFKFDNKQHAATCNIDENNKIYLTVHESDINGYKKKISGYADNKNITIYELNMVDHGIGYYKYQAQYAVISSILLKCGKKEAINNIYDFRFTFEPLNDWLGIKTIFINETQIDLKIPEDIKLIENEYMSIRISFFKEGNDVKNNQTQITEINDFKIVPYINCKFKNKISRRNIIEYVQCITRFFSSLIGYTGNVKEILFHNYIDGKIKFDFIENKLVVNTNFSNRFSISEGYGFWGYRVKYDNVKNCLEDLFFHWYEKYNNKEYSTPIMYYFSPYLSETLEEEFLRYIKILEKLSICKDDKNKEKNNIKNMKKILSKFYKDHSNEIVNELKSKKIKNEYVKNIENIHEEIINQVVKKYKNRKTLYQRLKELDNKGYLKEIFKERHICNKKNTQNQLSVYDYLAKTRNYYTHLDSNANIINVNWMTIYNRVLEKIVVRELLNLMKLETNKLEESIENDRYLNLYKEM